MSKIFITGSTDGLGLMAAKALSNKGHQVVLHARNAQRAKDAEQSLPKATGVLVADLSNMEETKKLANDVNGTGPFDSIIHNAGVNRVSGTDLANVNILAPYILTCLIHKPKRIIYVSSGMHFQGNLKLEQLGKSEPAINYSDSKLQLCTLAMAVAEKWPDVYVNAINPGWVPTKMGGAGACDDLQKGFETQVWLADGTDENANITGHYLHYKKDSRLAAVANDDDMQERLLKVCEQATGISFPA